MQRGLNIFTSEEYYKEQQKNKDILCTEKDLNNFKLFMFREICKSMDKELVQKYIDKYPTIINLVLEKAPHFFVSRDLSKEFLDNGEQIDRVKNAIEMNRFWDRSFTTAWLVLEEPEPLNKNPVHITGSDNDYSSRQI
ncbi:MAG: hypothetical protein RCO49_04775 [Rickettsia endosymbiont of Argas persicus]